MPEEQGTQRHTLRELFGAQPILRARELRKAGVAPQTIARAVEDGEIERISRGLYQYADADNLQPVPAWWRLDAGVRYRRLLWADTLTTFRLTVENLTDNNSWTSAGGFPGFGYLVLSEPRTLQGSVTFDF